MQFKKLFKSWVNIYHARGERMAITFDPINIIEILYNIDGALSETEVKFSIWPFWIYNPRGVQNRPIFHFFRERNLIANSRIRICILLHAPNRITHIFALFVFVILSIYYKLLSAKHSAQNKRGKHTTRFSVKIIYNIFVLFDTGKSRQQVYENNFAICMWKFSALKFLNYSQRYLYFTNHMRICLALATFTNS